LHRAVKRDCDKNATAFCRLPLRAVCLLFSKKRADDCVVTGLMLPTCPGSRQTRQPPRQRRLCAQWPTRNGSHSVFLRQRLPWKAWLNR